MRVFKTGFVLALVLMLFATAYAEPRHRKFTKEEIKKMAETKAVIETKFGNIELRFFPDVAPNHVNVNKSGTLLCTMQNLCIINLAI